MATNARRTLFYLALLMTWEVIFRLNLWPEFLFPSPLQVLQALIDGFSEQRYVAGIVASLRRIVVGYGISVLVGTLLGLVQARWRLVDETLGSLILGLQTLPSICWLPLALLWFGLSEKAIVFVVIMGSLLSIAIATEHGVKHTPPLLIRAAETMGARGLKMYVDVILPAALPSVIEGMKQGWSFAWRSLMAGELLFVSMGLGQLLSIGRELNDMSQVVAVMLVIIGIGLCVDRLVFARLGNSVRRRWGLQTA
jgi:NitT/TauT family transport system permease protein